MCETRIGRRQWLAQASAITSISAAPRQLTLRAFEPDGAPCDKRRLESTLLADRDGLPYEVVAQVTEPGVATVPLPPGPFELSTILPVKGFGSVYLYADKDGGLYPPESGELLLNYEFARSRAAFVRRYMKAAHGVVFSAALQSRLERGEAALRRATEAREISARVRYANESLADTMWAGEIAALERARQRIARQGSRPGFLFGGYSYPFAKTDEHLRLFTDLFNALTLALYRRGTDAPYFRPGVEREEGKPDYSLAMAAVKKVDGMNLSLKGHPLMWFALPGLPEFLRTKSWADLKQSCGNHILRTVGLFKSRVHVWDVINEAHDTANLLGFNHDQLLELTRFACQMTRVADPTAFRVVNANAPWAEYVQRRRTPDGKKSWSPMSYFAAVEAARIPYDAIGLQFYNPRRDMLEIERQMERFFVFGKPIHITELGISSSSDPAPRSQMAPSSEVWHGDRWTEEIQADWVEQYYTICYSKPEIDAVIWWNFTDPSLFAHAGLITEDLRPKPAYQRLLKLVKSWRA